MHPNPIAADRNLTPNEHLLLERLLSAALPDSELFLTQISSLRVVWRCTCGCNTIGISINKAIHATDSKETSQIIARGRGISPEGIMFNILLHTRKKQLSELEITSTDGERSFTLPDVNQIGFSKPEPENSNMRAKIANRQRFAWLAILLFIIPYAVILFFQAIENLREGNFSGGYNYIWQHVDPLTQIVMSAVLVFVGVAKICQLVCSKGK